MSLSCTRDAVSVNMFGSYSQPVRSSCGDEEMLCPECEPEDADDDILGLLHSRG